MTGATGFLGSKLLARLANDPGRYQVTVLKRSTSDTWRIADLLTDLASFDLDRTPIPDIFGATPFDTILHCATDYGRKPVPRSEMIEANLVLPLRLLETGVDHGVRTFISTDTMLDKNVSDYTLSKRQFREWLQNMSARMAGINMVIEHFYGPGDDATKFVASIVRSLLDNEKTIPLTPGLQRRDFIYIDDVVDAFLCVLREVEGGSTGYFEFEVGTGHSITIQEFVATAKDVCGNTGTCLEFGALQYRQNEPMEVRVDIAKLQALGWRANCSLREGLKQTLAFERARRA
jgi:nucleoside-diphosphate-sugar epimerase